MWIKANRTGFTIVELLIVIVVIGILAAITLIAYNGIQNRAKIAVAQSDLETSVKAIEYYKLNNAASTGIEQYPADLPTAQAAGLIKLSPGDTATNYISNNTISPAYYCLSVSNSVGQYSMVSTQSGSLPGTCTTNLITNPKVALTASNWSGRSSSGGTYTSARITGQTTPDSSVTTVFRTTLTAAPATWWRVYYAPASVTPGQTYTFSGWVRASIATTLGANIIWKDSGGATISENSGTYSSAPANTWLRRSSTATAPAGTVTAQLEVGSPNTAAVGSTLDGTGFLFEVASQANNYADGDYAGWIWNGTPSGATSSGPVTSP